MKYKIESKSELNFQSFRKQNRGADMSDLIRPEHQSQVEKIRVRLRKLVPSRNMRCDKGSIQLDLELELVQRRAQGDDCQSAPFAYTRTPSSMHPSAAPQGTCHSCTPCQCDTPLEVSHIHTHTYADVILCYALSQTQINAHIKTDTNLVQIHRCYLLENKKQLLKFMQRVKLLIVSHQQRVVKSYGPDLQHSWGYSCISVSVLGVFSLETKQSNRSKNVVNVCVKEDLFLLCLSGDDWPSAWTLLLEFWPLTNSH